MSPTTAWILAVLLLGAVLAVLMLWLASAGAPLIDDPFEMDLSLPPEPLRVSVPVTLTGGPIPRRRRFKRALRALLHFFTAPRIDLS